MLLLGEKQTLVIVKEVEFGVYLAEEADSEDERVLLPKKQVPPESRIGDSLTVFLYRDSKDRLIATRKEPYLTLHQIAECEVAAVGSIGVFLNWGLEKDLFLPFKEQTYPVSKGDKVLAALYIDKSNRLCATMKIYPYLSQESPYQRNDKVTGEIYEISENFGAFVAVDGKYSALIPKREIYEKLKPGSEITARVAEVKPDGKLDLSLREKAYLQMDKDTQIILKLLEENQGVLPFSEKASPELIRQNTGMSKNEFKRAIGRLYKERKITIVKGVVKILEEPKKV